MPRSSVGFFCLTVPKTSYGNSSVFQKFSDTKKIVDKKGDGGSIRIFRRKNFWHIVSKPFAGDPLVFHYLGVSKFFMLKSLISRCCVKNVLSCSTETFRRGTLLCFRKIRVSKVFMPRRGISRFFVVSFSFHSADELRMGTFLSLRNSVVPQNFCG